MSKSQPEYPKRHSHFAHRFVRILHKSCAAQDIGPTACYLLCVIAHTEDAGRYAGPARFWNSQLSETMGFRSPQQLVRERNRAIAGGWLVYYREGTRAVGNYFVTIPERFADLSDSAIERPIHSKNGTNQTGDSFQNRNESVTEPGTLSKPLPSPVRVLKALEPKNEERKKRKRPNYTPFDLTNPIDLHNAYELTVSMGYGGIDVMKFFAAAARTVRKEKGHGYFARAVLDGAAEFIEANEDMETAKRMLNETGDW
jgi:hypothetical protein